MVRIYLNAVLFLSKSHLKRCCGWVWNLTRKLQYNLLLNHRRISWGFSDFVKWSRKLVIVPSSAVYNKEDFTRMLLLLLVKNLPILYSHVTVIHVFNFFLHWEKECMGMEKEIHVLLNAVVYETYWL